MATRRTWTQLEGCYNEYIDLLLETVGVSYIEINIGHKMKTLMV